MDSIIADVLMVVGIVLSLFLSLWIMTLWIRMLIDCVHRDFKNPTDKIVWILVLVFLNFLGAVLYYFLVKNKK